MLRSLRSLESPLRLKPCSQRSPPGIPMPWNWRSAGSMKPARMQGSRPSRSIA